MSGKYSMRKGNKKSEMMRLATECYSFAQQNKAIWCKITLNLPLFSLEDLLFVV